MKNKILKLTVAMAAVIILTAALFVVASAEVYTGECGENVTYSLDTETGVLEINGTGKIGSYALWDSYRSVIKTVIISDGVTSIGDDAFRNCTGLTNVTIGKNVTSIGEGAFEDCSSLKSVSIPNNVTTIGSRAFYDCTALSSVKIGTGVKTIETYAFYNCESLTSVEIPDSVTTLGVYVFQDCSALKDVTIGDGLSLINTSAFGRCSSLTNLTIGKGVTKIGLGAFSGCSSLRSVLIPDNVVTIGDDAFRNCTGLTNVTIGKNVTSIGEGAFEDCSSLKSVSIPNNVTKINYRAFYDCTALSSVKIGTGVKTIETYAFYNCESLKSIVIPDNVTSLGMGVFQYCKNLSHIVLGNGLISIGNSVISSCDMLKTIYLHKNSYADEHFRNSSHIKVYITSTSDVYIVDTSPSFGLTVAQYTLKIVDENNNPISGATVTWGEKIEVTDTTGVVQFSYPENLPHKLTVTADNYIRVDIDGYKANNNEALDVIEMFKNTGSDQIIPLTCNGKLISSSFARINNKADLVANIKVKGVSNKKISKFQLKQGKTVLAESSDGEFTVANSMFITNIPVEVYLYTEDGQYVRKTLNISVNSFTCSQLLFNSTSSKIKIPVDVTLLGGMEFTIKITDAIDVAIDILNDGFKVGVNMDVYEKDLSSLNRGFREWKSKNKQKVSSDSITANIGGYIAADIRDDLSYEIYSELVLSICYKHEIGKTFQVWIFPIRGEFEVGGEFELIIKNLEFDYANGKIKCEKVNGDLSFGITGRAGVGGYLASAGVYGKAALNFDMDLYPFINYPASINKATLTGEFGIYGKVKWLGEKRFKLVNGELVIFDKGGTTSYSLAENVDIYDVSSYTVPARSYLAATSDWDSCIDGIIQSGVYNGSDPQILDAGDLKLMAYIGDNGCDDYNYNQLMYSVFTEDGWSAPVTVDKNSFSDVDFDLYSDGENIWVVYSQANRTITSEDEAEAIAGTIEVVVAKFNKSKGTFGTPVTITNNDTMDSNAKITVVNGIPVIAWVSNTDNNVFGMTANNTIYMSQYKSGKWSAPTVVAENVPAVIGIDVGYLDSKICFAVIHDSDSDFNTSGDGVLTVYKVSGAPYSYAVGSYENVLFDGEDLYWYKDYSIYTVDTFGAEENLVSDSFTVNSAADFEVINYNGYKYILYRVYNTEGEYGGSDLYAIVNNGNEWSAPVRLTNTEGYVDSFDVLAVDGGLITVYRRTDVSFAGEEMTTSCELCSDILEVEAFLGIEDISYDFEDLFGDNTITLKVTVINNGMTTAKKFTVTAGSATKKFETSLAPGATATVEIVYNLSDSESATVTVTDENEISVSKDAEVHFFDFETNIESKLIGSSRYINATVRNEGNIEGTGTLYIRRDSADGSVIYSEEMTLTNGNQKYILLEIVDDTLTEAYIEFVPSEGTDYYDGNNSCATSIVENTEGVYGDLNGDGDINSIDAVLLAQYIAGWDVELDEMAADCNGDGNVNSIDAVLLAQFIAGWDVTLG